MQFHQNKYELLRIIYQNNFHTSLQYLSRGIMPNCKQVLKQGHPKSIFGKYLFRRRFEIQKFRNFSCKISCLPASPRIIEHQCLEFSGAFFLAEIFENVSFDPYNFRITTLSARKSEKMKTFGGGIKICLHLPFKY